MLRALAEMENMRKRTERAVADTRDYAITGYDAAMVIGEERFGAIGGPAYRTPDDFGGDQHRGASAVCRGERKFKAMTK